MIPREDIEQMYCNEKMSMIEISEVVGVSDRTVCNWIKKYGIVSRRNSKLHLMSTIKPSKKELENMYREGMSMHDIAKKVGVGSATTVFDWMKEYGIESRTYSESMLTNVSKLSKERLEKMYRSENISAYEIAKIIGVSHSTVYCWMKEYGIDIRTISEARVNGDFTGENSPGWKGGISGGKYCYKFNNKFKEAVRERDGYTCQLCGCEQNGRKLSVHHIHYLKEDCYPDVVALCDSCNSVVNSDRDSWELFFEDQLEQRKLLNWNFDG